MTYGGAARLGRLVGLSCWLMGGAAAAEVERPLVTAVEIRGDAAVDRPDELAELVAVVPGEPLNRAAVARTLRNLHAYGVAGEIAAFTRPEAGGVAVVFGLWVRYEVEEVRIVGEPGLKRAQLQRQLLQRESQPLSESKVIRGVYRLQDLYRTYGYMEAVVRVEVRTNERRKRATVIYNVAGGPRARVGSIAFDGDVGPFTPEELMGPMRSEPGRHHHQVAAASDSERLQDWLIGRGFRTAIVDPPAESYDSESHQMGLLFSLQLGPRFEVEAPGLDLDRLRRKGLLPFLEVERFDETLLEQSREALVRHFQEQGRYDVRVELSQAEGPEGVTIGLEIEPGPVYRLRSLEFTGNEAVERRQLTALMETAPGGSLFGSGRLVDEVLESDLANIRSFYALLGYGDARVGPAAVSRTGGDLRVTIPILEGLQRRVVNVELAGALSLPLGEILPRLALQPAGPFHPRLLEQSIDQVRAFYEAAGMRSTQVDADLAWNEERSLVDVRIRILEGPRSAVDRIIVRGHQRTRPSLIRRAVGLGRDDVLSAGQLLEAQRGLYELGVFSRVEVKLAPGTPFSEERDVLVQLEEGSHRSVSYGVGYDSEDGVRGLLGVGHRNLFGRAVSGRIDVRVSQREQQIRALLRQPLFRGRRLPISYSLFQVEEERGSFDSRRRGAQMEAERVSGSDRYALLLSYRLVEVEDPDPALEELEIDRELREADILSLGPSVFLDHRDDPVDPRRGWSTNLVVEYAFPALGAETGFLKLFGQQTAHVDLRGFGTVAASLRLGTIDPDPGNPIDSTVPAGLSSAQIPISERFFAGGRSSHRAYRRDELGVPGQTLVPFLDPDDPDAEERLVPVGGSALALLNLDYRFPIAGPVGGVAFVDVGNVWGEWGSVDLGEARTGAGLGVRYLSPIGPIRLEVGWKLDREPGEDDFVVFFSVGNPF